MINDARTLLLNQPGPHEEDPSIAGDVFIPTYTPVELPQSLTGVRRVLFGTQPDYEGRIYRTAQYMAILDNTEFGSYQFVADSRITYDSLATDIADQQDFGADITLSQGPALTVSGTWMLGAFVGRVVTQWRILGTDVAQVTATNTTTGEAVSYDLATDTDLVLPGSTLRISFGDTVSSGDQWRITHRSRPAPDLGVVLATLSNMTVLQRTALFGELPPTAEPDLTFFNLLTQHYSLTYQLSGVLLALIARTRALVT